MIINNEYSTSNIDRGKTNREVAREVLNHFSYESEIWSGPTKGKTDGIIHVDGSSTWVFRGQEDSQWGLTPSAHRDIWTKINPKWTRANFDDKDPSPLEVNSVIAHNINYEYAAMYNFILLADKMGFAIPNSTELRKELSNSLIKADEAIYDNWDYTVDKLIQEKIKDLSEAYKTNLEFDKFVREFALAQHHGIPTRLLDWSKDPKTALFVATKDCYIEPSINAHSKDFAIWSLNSYDFLANHNDGKNPIKIVELQYNENQNLRNQSGVFTQSSDPYHHFYMNNSWPDQATEISNYINEKNFDEKIFVKHIISKELVVDILKLLYKQNYHLASFNQSLDTITKNITYWNSLFSQ